MARIVRIRNSLPSNTHYFGSFRRPKRRKNVVSPTKRKLSSVSTLIKRTAQIRSNNKRARLPFKEKPARPSVARAVFSAHNKRKLRKPDW